MTTFKEPLGFSIDMETVRQHLAKHDIHTYRFFVHHTREEEWPNLDGTTYLIFEKEYTDRVEGKNFCHVLDEFVRRVEWKRSQTS